ncbi:uncharacterized protein UTRI_05457 [Ustilago trichophora]|uniref:Uncharacterized protein n=1 Tax=Ustilago trichophora TaxID=86804 RepID=A0A5C3EHT9_9BASI|nr:uncharacterized protein UTRI_05457 [Ustilago trichophora]
MFEGALKLAVEEICVNWKVCYFSASRARVKPVLLISLCDLASASAFACTTVQDPPPLAPTNTVSLFPRSKTASIFESEASTLSAQIEHKEMKAACLMLYR